MQFYTYVWYDQDWIPYYVGKGVGVRSRQRRDIPHPEEGHVVLKYFDLEEEAFEHEKALIAFWGRRSLDTNGLLMNKALGGPGSPGVMKSAEVRNKISKTKAADPQKMAEARAMDWIVVSPTGEQLKVHNLKDFCRENSLCNKNLHSVAAGRRKHHKGWKCRHA